MNVLQPNSGIVNNANLNLLKVNQTITAKADSTNVEEFDGQGPTTPVAIDPRTGMPFKKHHHSVKKFQTPSVSRRNARERNRVKQVNDGFSTLKNHVPNLKNKTSKVDTLRAAVDYIRALRSLLGQPIKDEALHRGPVLITDMDDSLSETSPKVQKRSRKSEAENISTTQSNTVLSTTDFSSLVYSLPPMMLMEELDLRSPSPSSSVSPMSIKMNSNYYNDGKENLSESFSMMGGMDLCGNQAPNWNWTNTSINEGQ